MPRSRNDQFRIPKKLIRERRIEALDKAGFSKYCHYALGNAEMGHELKGKVHHRPH